MEIHPGKGVLIEDVPNTRKPLHWPVWGKFLNLEGQPDWEGNNK